jgi:hypothetical protein
MKNEWLQILEQIEDVVRRRSRMLVDLAAPGASRRS